MTPVTIAWGTCFARTPATRQMIAQIIAATASTPESMTKGRLSIEQMIAAASRPVSARLYRTIARCGPEGFSGPEPSGPVPAGPVGPDVPGP